MKGDKGRHTGATKMN
jgi:Kinesin motor domain